jgi:hypothetical protein
MKFPGTKMFFVLMAVSLAGFFAGGFEPAQARRASARHAAPAASAEDCKKDADCVAVVDDCCPCSQGGALRALPRKQKDAYEKERKKRCAGTMCTQAVSQDPTCGQRPFCGAGICELEDPPAGAAAGGAK